MIRLYLTDSLSPNKNLSLSEFHIHYLLHVMRRHTGDIISVFNGKDGEWSALISKLDKKSGTLSLQTQTRTQTETIPLILCPALIKKENMDLVIQKATELGVSDIYPLLTDRTVIGKLNLERAQSLAIEASEQSERLSVPTIHTPLKLIDFLNQHRDLTPVCLSERGETNLSPSPKPFAFCIGPEGGWTPAELESFKHYHASFWHLGNTILRAETASIVALACASFQFK